VGQYFACHHPIRECNAKPEAVLEALQKESIAQCEQRDLQGALTELTAISYSKELIEMMPDFVYMAKDDLDLGLELELEEEQEHELELENEQENEMEFENEKQSKIEVPYYLPRLETNLVHKACEKIHPAYDPTICFTDSFLPLSRQDPLYGRTPFDDKMYRIGVINCKVESVVVREGLRSRLASAVTQYVIGDLLDEHLHSPYEYFAYDLRTQRVYSACENQIKYVPGTTASSCDNELISSSAFLKILVQIKFLDGQIENYADQEIGILEEWLKANNIDLMREHFENEVLRYRNDLKATYRHSQLYKLWSR
jgi:hypothetical protein